MVFRHHLLTGIRRCYNSTATLKVTLEYKVVIAPENSYRSRCKANSATHQWQWEHHPSKETMVTAAGGGHKTWNFCELIRKFPEVCFLSIQTTTTTASKLGSGQQLFQSGACYSKLYYKERTPLQEAAFPLQLLYTGATLIGTVTVFSSRRTCSSTPSSRNSSRTSLITSSITFLYNLGCEEEKKKKRGKKLLQYAVYIRDNFAFSSKAWTCLLQPVLIIMSLGFMSKLALNSVLSKHTSSWGFPAAKTTTKH